MRQPTSASFSMLRAIDLDSTKNRTANGNCAAKRKRAAICEPHRGVTPKIKRSTSSRVSARGNPLEPNGRLTTANSLPRMRASVSRTTSDSSMTKIRFIHLSPKIRGRADRLANRDVNEKRRPLSHGTLDGNETAMFLHDLMRHR